MRSGPTTLTCSSFVDRSGADRLGAARPRRGSARLASAPATASMRHPALAARVGASSRSASRRQSDGLGDRRQPSSDRSRRVVEQLGGVGAAAPARSAQRLEQRRHVGASPRSRSSRSLGLGEELRVGAASSAARRRVASSKRSNIGDVDRGAAAAAGPPGAAASSRSSPRQVELEGDRGRLAAPAARGRRGRRSGAGRGRSAARPARRREPNGRSMSAVSSPLCRRCMTRSAATLISPSLRAAPLPALRSPRPIGRGSRAPSR